MCIQRPYMYITDGLQIKEFTCHGRASFGGGHRAPLARILWICLPK